MDKTEALYNQACEEAIKTIEKLARQAFRKDERLTEFVIAMGSATFATEEIDILDDTDLSEYPAMKPTFDFLDKWDDVLKLSGAGLWFKSDGSTITKW